MKAVRAAVALFWALMGLIVTGKAVPISGQVNDTLGNAALTNARVTFFTPDLRLFREQRTDAFGKYSLTLVAEGNYRLGVAAVGYEYQERPVAISNVPVTNNFSLVIETN